MTDAEYAAWCERVKGRVLFWLPRCGLDRWTWVVSYHRTAVDDAERKHPAGYGTPFRITCDWRYMNLHLEAFCQFLHEAKPNDRELDRMIVHEFMHCVVAELRIVVPEEAEELHTDHEEHVISWLTQIVCGLYEEFGAWDVKQQRKIVRLTRELAKVRAAA